MHINSLRLILVIASAYAAGCSGGGAGAKMPVPLDALETRPYASRDFDGSSFVTNRDLTINGQAVPKGSYIVGMRSERSGTAYPWDQVKWKIPPEFQTMRGRGNIVFGKRFGATKWVRFDMSGATPKEEPTPYDDVVRIYYSINPEATGWSDNDRWVGVEKDAKRFTIVDKTGKPAIVLNDVYVSNARFAISLLPKDGAMVVVHNTGDRLYARDGTPLSPELPSLWRDYVVRLQWQSMAPEMTGQVFGVRTDREHPRYWLVQDNGRTLPKPDDLIGLQPLTTKFKHWTVWSGWLVWWQTPDGERCARVEIKDGTDNLPALIASREKAEFVEWVVNWNEDRACFDDIRRRPGQTKYEINRPFNPTRETFANVASAEKWLETIRRTEAEERSKMIAAQNQAKQLLKAQEQARLEREQAERRAREARTTLKAIEAAQVAFDTAFSANDRSASRTHLLKVPHDPYRWTQYVKKYGLDPMGQNGSNSIGYSRAWAGGADPAVLKDALKRSLPPPQPAVTYSKPQSDWDYFWNGPRGGAAPTYSGGGFDPNASHQQFQQRMEATRQQNFDAWMRGAQNWGGPR